MCFPDENYCFDDMTDSVFLGAYDGERCVGLAVLQPGFFKYMYLYDLKVDRAYRGRHIGKMLIDAAKETAARLGYSDLSLRGRTITLPPACFISKSASVSEGSTQTSTATQARRKKRILYSTRSAAEGRGTDARRRCGAARQREGGAAPEGGTDRYLSRPLRRCGKVRGSAPPPAAARRTSLRCVRLPSIRYAANE